MLSQASFALLGLDADLRILWASEGSAEVLDEPGLEDRMIAEVLPTVDQLLERQQPFPIAHPRKAQTWLEVVPSRVEHAGLAWMLRIEPRALPSIPVGVVPALKRNAEGAMIGSIGIATDLSDTAALWQTRSHGWQLVIAQFQQRQETAREIHQGVLQVLTALLLRLSALRGAISAEEIDALRDLARGAMHSARILSGTLAPTTHELGLVRAFKELARLLAEHGNLRLSTTEGPGKRYPEAVEIASFDAVRILLTSLVRRGAREASLSLHDGSEGLRIIVEVYGLQAPIEDLVEGLRKRLQAQVQGRAFLERATDSVTVVLCLPVEPL